jgi:hypothetical protein
MGIMAAINIFVVMSMSIVWIENSPVTVISDKYGKAAGWCGTDSISLPSAYRLLESQNQRAPANPRPVFPLSFLINSFLIDTIFARRHLLPPAAFNFPFRFR